MTTIMRPSMALTEIYLYPQAVDFRRSFRGLSAIVECELGHNPFNGHLYVFTNKRRSISGIKAICYPSLQLAFRVVDGFCEDDLAVFAHRKGFSV